MTRPANIVVFERVSYTALLLTIASMPLNWDTVAPYFHKHPVLYPVILFVFLAIEAVWIWLIARKRKNWARWVWTVVYVFSLPQLVIDAPTRFAKGITAASLFYLISLLGGIATCLMFTSQSRAWFRGQKDVQNVVDTFA